jgi:hypothetical protein
MRKLNTRFKPVRHTGLQPCVPLTPRLLLRKYLVELPRRGLTAVNFQSPGKKSPLATQSAVGKGHPIFVTGNECDVGLVNFPPPHFEFAVIHFDPPFATSGAAQLPLVAQMNAFRFIRLKTLPHSIEHFLWRRIWRLVRRGHDRAQANCNSYHRDSQQGQPIHLFNYLNQNRSRRFNRLF